MTQVAEKPVAKPAIKGQFRAQRSELVAAATPCAAIVSFRAHQPVLQCVKIDARDDRVIMESRGKSFEAVRVTLAAVQIEHPFTAFVNAQKFLAVMNAAGGDTLIIGLSENGLTVIGDGSKFTIANVVDADLPPIEEVEGASAKIAGKDLLRVLAQTKFAADPNDSRAHSQSINFRLSKNSLQCETTEGHVMAVATAACECTKPVTVLVQAGSACQIIPKLFGDDDEITIAIGNANATFTGEVATASIPLIEGWFPSTEGIVPRDGTKLFTCGREAFLAAILSSVAIAEQDKQLRLAFSKRGAELSFKCAEGESSINFPAKYEGADMTIGFDGAFLIEILRAAQTDEIEMHMNAPNRPALFKAGSDFRAVCMPVNLN